MGEGCHDCCAGFMRCLSRIPCASLIAFVLFGLAITIYLGSILSAFETVIEFFHYDFNVKGVVVPLYIVFLALAAFFIIFAFLTTGETRKEVCKKECCNVTGRIVQVICIAVTWVMNFIFVIISGVTLIPLVIFLLMNATCQTKFVKGLTNCITLETIGFHPANNTICGKTASDFCHKVGEINQNIIAAYIASVIICISLILFLMAMSANYVHMKDELAKDDYEDLEKQK